MAAGDGHLRPVDIPRDDLSDEAKQAGWSVQISKRTGKPYYYNQNTKKSTYNIAETGTDVLRLQLLDAVRPIDSTECERTGKAIKKYQKVITAARKEWQEKCDKYIIDTPKELQSVDWKSLGLKTNPSMIDLIQLLSAFNNIIKSQRVKVEDNVRFIYYLLMNIDMKDENGKSYIRQQIHTSIFEALWRLIFELGVQTLLPQYSAHKDANLQIRLDQDGTNWVDQRNSKEYFEKEKIKTSSGSKADFAVRYDYSGIDTSKFAKDICKNSDETLKILASMDASNRQVYHFGSVKYYSNDSKKSAQSFDVQQLEAEIMKKISDPQYASMKRDTKYEVIICIRQEDTVRKLFSRSRIEVLRNIDQTNILGEQTLLQLLPELMSSCQRYLDKISDYKKPTISKTPRLHQKYIIEHIYDKINNDFKQTSVDNKEYLIGAVARSGKTYTLISLLRKILNNIKDVKKVAIYTPFPTETLSQWRDELNETLFVDKEIKDKWGKSFFMSRDGVGITEKRLKDNENWIVLSSTQKLKNDGDSKNFKNEEIKQLEKADIVILDEAHEGGITAKTKQLTFMPDSMVNSGGKRVIIYLTATYGKIEIARAPYVVTWDYYDTMKIKKIGNMNETTFQVEYEQQVWPQIQGMFSYEINGQEMVIPEEYNPKSDKHNPDEHRLKLQNELRQSYDRFPDMHSLGALINKQKPKELLDNWKNTLWQQIGKGKGYYNFSHPVAVQYILKSFIESYDGDGKEKPTVYKQIEHISESEYGQLIDLRGFRTGLRKPMSQLWFLQYGDQQAKNCGVLLPLLVQLMKIRQFRENYGFVSLNHSTKDLQDIIPKEEIDTIPNFWRGIRGVDKSNMQKQIQDAEIQNWKNGNRMTIFLTCSKATTGITLPCVDIVVLLNNFGNFDKNYQKIFRALTDRPNKKAAYIVDPYGYRVISANYQQIVLSKFKNNIQGKYKTRISDIQIEDFVMPEHGLYDIGVLKNKHEIMQIAYDIKQKVDQDVGRDPEALEGRVAMALDDIIQTLDITEKENIIKLLENIGKNYKPANKKDEGKYKSSRIDDADYKTKGKVDGEQKISIDKPRLEAISIKLLVDMGKSIEKISSIKTAIATGGSNQSELELAVQEGILNITNAKKIIPDLEEYYEDIDILTDLKSNYDALDEVIKNSGIDTTKLKTQTVQLTWVQVKNKLVKTLRSILSLMIILTPVNDTMEYQMIMETILNEYFRLTVRDKNQMIMKLIKSWVKSDVSEINFDDETLFNSVLGKLIKSLVEQSEDIVRGMVKSRPSLQKIYIEKTQTVEDALKWFNNNLGVREEQKNKNGEVFTPHSLIKEMLDQFPKSVWSNSKLKWLDPAAGYGQFMFEVVRRLMDGLKDEIKQSKQRLKHILTKQIYQVEFNPVSARVINGIFSFEGIKPNVLSCSFVSGSGYNQIYQEDIIIKKDDGSERKIVGAKFEGVDKFDCIIGNPPYQKSDSSGDNKLYIQFTEDALTKHLVEGGYVNYVLPPGVIPYIVNLNKNRSKLEKLYNILYLNYSKHLQTLFKNIGSDFCYFFIQNSDYKGPTVLVDRLGNQITKTLKQGDTVLTILDPDIVRVYNKLCCKDSYEFKKFQFDGGKERRIRKKTLDDGIVSSNPLDDKTIKIIDKINKIHPSGEAFYYSQKDIDYGKPKLAIYKNSLSSIADPGNKQTYSDNFVYVLTDHPSKLKMILNSKIIKFLYEMQFRSYGNDIPLIEKLCKIDESRINSEEDVYKMYNLNKMDLMLIEAVINKDLGDLKELKKNIRFMILRGSKDSKAASGGKRRKSHRRRSRSRKSVSKRQRRFYSKRRKSK